MLRNAFGTKSQGRARAIVKKITFKKLLTFGSKYDNIISVKGEMRKKKSSKKKLKKLLTNKSKDDIIKSSKRERKSKATEIKKIKKNKKGLDKTNTP